MTSISITPPITIENTWQIQGGTLGATQPTFNGPPLFSGTYIKINNLVHFEIQVDMDNITNFGIGQYYITLPFPSRFGYKFRDGCLHDISDNKTYHTSGHVYPGSNQLTLFTTDVSGQNLYDFPFEQGEPITLSTADNLHISGTYIV